MCYYVKSVHKHSSGALHKKSHVLEFSFKYIHLVEHFFGVLWLISTQKAHVVTFSCGSSCLRATLPCSTCERMSLASVTLRIDSPWPVHDTAPLELSAYPPQPSSQKKETLKIHFLHWQLLVLVGFTPLKKKQ